MLERLRESLFVMGMALDEAVRAQIVLAASVHTIVQLFHLVLLAVGRGDC